MRKRAGRSAENGCWERRNGKTGCYGALRRLNGTRDRVHWVSYEIYEFEMPDSTVIDHLCANPSCCRVPGQLNGVASGNTWRAAATSAPTSRP